MRYEDSDLLSLWLDDLRPPPTPDWTWVKTGEDAIVMLKSVAIGRISLDHDLGPFSLDGYEVARFIEAAAFEGTLHRLAWSVHSANPVGATRIAAALRSADRFWEARTPPARRPTEPT